MKNIYKYLMFALVLISSSTIGFSQVLILEDFESTDLPDGWQSPTLPPFATTTSQACDGRSVRGALNSSSTNPELIYMSQEVTGEDIIVSFDYKLLENTSTATATDEDFGQFELQYSVDNKNWVTYDRIVQSNHTPSTSCTQKIDTIAGVDVPAGSDFGWRIKGQHNQGDNYIYIDNFEAVEDVPCKQPIDLTVENTTFDEIEISWTEFNSSPATEWEVAYCPEGTDPSNPACFLSNIDTGVTSNPYTVTGLNDGTKYDFYVRSVCDSTSNVESAWSGPLRAQTVAIGTDCDAPIEVTSLPYSDSSDTELYDNIYQGTPGASCATSGDFLEGYDVVYHYQVSGGDDILQIDISGNLDGNVGAFVYTSCSDIGSECIAGAVTNSGDDFSIQDLYVDDGEDLYIVISTEGGDETTTEYNIDIHGFDCNGWVAPEGDSNYEFYNQTLADFSETRIGVHPTIQGAELRWYDDASLTNEITDLENEQLSNNDKYWVVQEVMGCTSPDLEITFEEFDCGDLTVTKVEADSQICDEGSVILEATGANADDLVWYAEETGGEPLATGKNFKTPVIDTTTTYWVGEFFKGEGELKNQGNPGPVSSDVYSSNEGLVFELTGSTVLIDVDVYVTGPADDLTVQLIDDQGNIREKTVFVPGGTSTFPTKVTVPLDFEINDPENGPFQLIKASGPDMMGTPGASYPYPLGTVGEITEGTSSSTYYYFYDWTIISSIPLCESDRKKVEAVVNETKEITVNVEQYDVCVGDDAKLRVESEDQDYEYTWEWEDESGATQTMQGDSIMPQMKQKTKFTVFAENPNTGCATEQDVEIDVVGVGEIPIYASDLVVCAGDIVEIFAGRINHDFETTSNISDWTFSNNSTPAPGVSDSVANWKQVNSPYKLFEEEIKSNDNSNFMITASDGLGPESSVSTSMTSPSMNLVGVSSAELTFYHYHKYVSSQSTTAKVLISIDGGNGWDELASYSSETGSGDEFQKETIDLDDYLGNANVQIRFEYSGNWGWWWAVDNVAINQTYANGNVLWSGDSQYDALYVDEQATVPYNGNQPINQLYFMADESGMYKFTTNLSISGCSDPVENDITIEVNDAEKPTGDTEQEFYAGARVGDIDVTGSNLQYFILDEDDNLVRQSINADLINGETYYISQRQNDCVSEFLEVQVSFVCPQPENLDVSSVDLSEDGSTAGVIVFWELPQNTETVDGYQIIIYDENEEVIEQEIVGSNTNYIIVESLPLEQDYTVELYSICDEENDIYSDVLLDEFSTRDLGLEGVHDVEFSYYPNPTRGEVNIESKTTIHRIDVYDLNGRSIVEIDNIDNEQKVIDFSGQASGTYLMNVQTDAGNKVVQVIKK